MTRRSCKVQPGVNENRRTKFGSGRLLRCYLKNVVALSLFWISVQIISGQLRPDEEQRLRYGVEEYPRTTVLRSYVTPTQTGSVNTVVPINGLVIYVYILVLPFERFL